MSDLVERQAAIDALTEYWDGISDRHPTLDGEMAVYADCKGIIKRLPSAQPDPQWIPFKTRPLTEEEQDEHPEWDCILDCKLPDDGQRILVSINLRGHEEV